MKNKLNHILLGLMAITMLTWSSCKDDDPKCYDETNPECENYDPCHGKREINKFFKVRPGDRGFPAPEEWCKLVPCDTFNASSVRFDIPDGSQEMSTFEWQIGTEKEPRIGKAFEVDFSDYLRDNGWERWIPITLTIRTPLNECMATPEDTLVSVTRELFFTEKSNPKWILGDFTLEGKLNNKPANIEIVFNDKVPFRGVTPPHYLIIGLPNYDTILYPQCRAEYCNNYRHIITRFNHPTCVENIDFGLISDETILGVGNKKIRRVWTFKDNAVGLKVYEFIGTKSE